MEALEHAESLFKTNTKNGSQFLLIKNHGKKASGYVQIIFLCQHVFVTSERSVEKEKSFVDGGGKKALKIAQAQNGKKRQVEVYENNRTGRSKRKNPAHHPEAL